MNIEIDLSNISAEFAELMSLPIELMMLKLFFLVGWIPIGIAFLWGVWQVWIDYIQGQWASKQKFILLAIDVPRNNVQSPKAVENLFTYFLGAHSTNTMIEDYWIGRFQLSFSFEIVSIEGYTQFLVHTPENFRDLVEAGVYSQYPDAEITEVNDYTQMAPGKYPDDEYDIWGTEFILVKPSVYPIKTYKEFEHQLGDPALTYRDPISSLMALCSSIGRGEQLWYQIIIKPIGFDWSAAGDKEIKKIMGEKVEAKKNIFESILDLLMEVVNTLVDTVTGGVAAGEEKKEEPFKMFNLKPREKKQMEKIQEKVSKGAFDTKIRMLYLAKRDVMNKPKVANGFVGYMKQYADLDINNLKPDSKVTQTSVSYFFANYRLNERKRKLASNYKSRSNWNGRLPFQLNIEELASLWHFPIEGVTASPTLQKAPGRKAVPPSSLPLEDMISSPEEELDPIFQSEHSKSASAKGALPGIFDEDIFAKETKQAPKVQTEDDDDIFVIPGKKKEKVEQRGTPPVNLPFG